MNDTVKYTETRDISLESILTLYRANKWSSAERPEALYNSLMQSHSLVSAWDGQKLVGLGSTLSDGYLVVYYSHLLVLPEYQSRGIGKRLMDILMERYKDFHQQVVIAVQEASGFYERCGFVRADGTQSMWIYAGNDVGHDRAVPSPQ